MDNALAAREQRRDAFPAWVLAPLRAIEGAGGTLSALLDAEQGRWFLWLPVFFGAGIGLYFELFEEPDFSLSLGLFVAALALRMLAQRNLFAFLVTSVLLCVSAGFFAAKLRWFPAGSWGNPDDPKDVALHLVLPVVAYGLPATGGVARWTRQCMAEAMASEYVRTAYAKGVRQFGVMAKHVLRNALIPMVTAFLPLFPGMMTGSMFIEQVFGLPGLGKYFVMSSTNRDYPLVLGITMFWAILIALTYFMTDILYGLIDPRVRITER